MTVVKSTGSCFLCYEPLIKMITVQSIWHIIIQNRCMSQGLNQHPVVTYMHSVSELRQDVDWNIVSPTMEYCKDFWPNCQEAQRAWVMWLDSQHNVLESCDLIHSTMCLSHVTWLQHNVLESCDLIHSTMCLSHVTWFTAQHAWVMWLDSQPNLYNQQSSSLLKKWSRMRHKNSMWVFSTSLVWNLNITTKLNLEIGW